MVCVRRAWLVDGDRTVALEDEGAGYYVTELDLGWPEVREVASPRPVRDGTDDRTTLMGSRAITANIVSSGDGWMTLDEAAAQFSPWMLASMRPELHYVLDRPGAPERFVTVRAAGYTWPVSGERKREIQLSWVAPDPVMYDPIQHQEISHSGADVIVGRTYPLTFDRVYPAGAGGAPTTAVITSPGDVPVRPVIQIWGPITDPVLTFDVDDQIDVFTVAFVTGFVIAADGSVVIDTDQLTVTDGAGVPILDRVDWSQTEWPVLPVLPSQSYMSLRGSSTTGVSQAIAAWSDGYLS